MTPRAVGIFALLFAVILFVEWFEFMRGLDVSSWPISKWFILAFIIIAESFAVAIVTRTVDRSLPDTGGRVAKGTRQPRRSTSRR